MVYCIDGLYYITHIDNLPSIFEHGVLSHTQMEKLNLTYQPIYDEGIVSRRQSIKAPNGRSLWEYANFYFQPRNPMLYRVTREKDISKIAILRLKPDLIKQEGAYIADGNAAHNLSQIFPFSEAPLKEIQQHLGLEFWGEDDGSKRKIMAECLIPEYAPPETIDSVYVYGNGAYDAVSSIVPKEVSVVKEPCLFFMPDYKNILNGTRITLIQGDMFLSQAQTLTVSVNTVGVMGKGLASRAKYQFPDVYVRYQDLCKQKELVVGKPFLVKRETSLASQLSEGTLSQEKPTWFLLFPTKKHWKENSDIQYIVDGLAWVKDHIKEWDVSSLALPALGCGLGGLPWEEVGPLMCQFAEQVGIPTIIYLPTETKTPPQFLTKEFLLAK